MTPMTSVDLERSDAAAGAGATGDRVGARSRTGSCRGRGRGACPGRPRAAHARPARARPGPARSCRRGAAASRSPQPVACATSGSRSKPAARCVRCRMAFCSGRSALELARARPAVEQVLHPDARCARRGRRRPARCRGRVVPTLAAQATSLLAAVEGNVVRHDHVGARLTRTRAASMPRLVEHVHLGRSASRVDHHAVADDRGDVRVKHAARAPGGA